MDSFNKVKAKIKIDKNYIKRDYETIGGMWTVDTWRQGDVLFQVLDEGYTEKIIIPFVLEVVKNFDNTLEFNLGNEDILSKLSQILQFKNITD